MHWLEWVAFTIIAGLSFWLATVIGYPPSYRRRKKRRPTPKG